MQTEEFRSDEREAVSDAKLTKEDEALKASIESLFNHLPAPAFSKSAETGRYLACNQAFAQYARKQCPADVVGLTDHEIFDKETADRFAADDRTALSMDKPHVIYEDLTDAAGVQRRYQTTRQRFTDESGRSCLLGMCVDVTGMTAMKQEASQTKDALTGVRNKQSFDAYTEQLQSKIDQGTNPKVAIGVFDCDNLNKINEKCGHDRGNTYLVAACRLICKVFKHSPVFRIGGDEFAVIPQGEDYENIDSLLLQFQEKQQQIVSTAIRPWEKVSVSFGIAVYCPQIDHSVKDLIRRADQMMYDNKRAKKNH